MEESGTTWFKGSRKKLAALVVGAAMIAGGLGATASVEPVETARDAKEIKLSTWFDDTDRGQRFSRSTWS